MLIKNVHLKAFCYCLRANPILALLCILFSAFLGLLPALEVQMIAYITTMDRESLFREGLSPLILLCSIIVGSYAFEFLLASCHSIFEQKIEFSTYRDFIKSLSYFNPKRLCSADDASKVMLTQDALADHLLSVDFQTVTQLLTISSILVSFTFLVSQISWKCVILMMFVILPLALASAIYAHLREWGRSALSQIHRRQDYLQRLLLTKQFAAEISLISANSYFSNELSKLTQKEEKIRLSCTNRTISAILILGTISTVACILLLYIIVNISGINYLVAIASGLITGISSVCSCAATLAESQSSNTALSCFFEMLMSKDGITQTKSDKIEDLFVQTVSFNYPNSDKGIRQATVDAKPGEIIAFVGGNGAGKTTLSKLIMGVLQPDTGSVDFGSGENRPAITAVLQDFKHFELTVREYLSLGGKYSDAELWSAIEAVGMTTAIKNLKDNLDAQLGERWGGSNLSGGQWQKLAIARTLLRGNCLRVYDEATAHIDSAFEEEIYRVLKQSSEGNITVLVSHRAWTLAAADRIYVLEDGRIVEQGTLQTLLAGNTKFKQLFASQLTEKKNGCKTCENGAGTNM